MSKLSRFMRAATEFLDVQDENRLAPETSRPPIFVRTTWMFVEIDEAIENIDRLTKQIKIARLSSDVVGAARLTADLLIIAKQTAQLVAITNDQFQKEMSNVG